MFSYPFFAKVTVGIDLCLEPRWKSHLGRSPVDRFHFVYDVVMSSLWHRETRLLEEVHHSGLSWACVRVESPSASRRWTCQACSSENYAWRAHCHSFNRAVDSECRGGNGGSSARRPAQRGTFRDSLSAGVRQVAPIDTISFLPLFA